MRPKVLAVVPARAGSKRLPQKNIKLLNGKPLIAHTFDEIQKSKYITTTVATSDCSKVIKISKQYANTYSLLRPEELASDTLKNVLINETLAKKFNIYDDPIGKKINAGFGDDSNDGKNLNIVGMVEDYHTNGLDRKILPTMMTHWNTFNWMRNNLWWMQFKIKPENADETLQYLENYWNDNVEQGYPFKAQFLNQRFAKTFKKYQNQKKLFLILTSVVIIISLLGLFALATLTIQQRLKEVAIRKTLGASVKEIMFQLMKSFLKITLSASVILIPIAYYFMQNWLDDFVYRVEMPIIPFIITPIILMVLVFVVVGLKAFNATKIDLIKYLKFE